LLDFRPGLFARVEFRSQQDTSGLLKVKRVHFTRQHSGDEPVEAPFTVVDGHKHVKSENVRTKGELEEEWFPRPH
jgi:hypothetical protein